MKPSPAEIQQRMSGNVAENFVQDMTEPRIVKVQDLLRALPPGQRILDIGCADGSILAPFTGVHEVHGVDICEPLVRQAAAKGLRAQAVNLDDHPLPFPDGSFDVVHSGETIEHLVDTDWFLAEANRVLKPGGTLILSFPNIRTLTSLLMMLFLDLPPMMSARYRAGHFRDFTLRTMRWALRNHHFAIQSVRGTHFFLPGLGAFGSALASHLPSWASVIVVRALKEQDSRYSAEDAAKDTALKRGMC